MTYPYQNHDDMDIHELHNSHSSNLPAIIIIFSKTALPYTPNQLTWTLGISAISDLRYPKTLGRVPRDSWPSSSLSGQVWPSTAMLPPLLPQGPAALSWMVGFDPHGVDMSAARSMAASWRIGRTGRTGNVQQKSWRSSPVHLSMTMYDRPKTVLIMLIQILILPQSQRCWTLRLHWRSAATVCVWGPLWLCVKL